MNTARTDKDDIRDIIINAFQEVSGSKADSIDDEENIFSKFGLDSMNTIALIGKLEGHFQIVIGEDVSDFVRMRTYSGLFSLVLEKIGKKPAIKDDSASG